MPVLLETGLSNAVAAALLALIAACAACVCRRPALLHALWLLVLVKLLTPPVFRIDISWFMPPAPAAEGQVETTLLPVPAPPPDLAPPVTTNGKTGEPTATEAPAVLPDGLAQAEPGVVDGLTPVPISTPSLAERAERADVSGPEPAAGALPRQTVLTAIWCLGVAGFLALSMHRLRGFRPVLQQAKFASQPEQDRVRELAGRLGLRRAPGLWLVPAPITPMLFALPGITRLLVPAGLWNRLSAERRDALVLHELAHLKRRDHWVRWLEMLVLALFFWHPVAWWARGRLRELEEQLADDWVLWATRASPDAAGTYAETLLEAVSFLSEIQPPLPQPASGFGHVRSLRRRLKMILCGDRARRLGLVGVLLVVALWSVALLFSPGLAQSPRADDGQDPLDRGSRVLGERLGERPGEPVAQAKPKPRPIVPAEAEPAPREYYARSRPALADQQDLKDEIELLTIQLEAKKAELQEAEALVEQANRRAGHVAKGSAAGAVSSSEVDQAQTDHRVQAARRRAKEAQVREVELRLQQANRRLARTDLADKPGGVSLKAREPHATARDETKLWVQPETASSGDARFDRLEQRLEELTREVSALRKELRSQRSGDPFPTKAPIYERVQPPKAAPFPEKAPVYEKPPPPVRAPEPEKAPLAK